MNTKLSVENLYKVFGPNPAVALQRVEQGQDKEQIFAETGMTVGVSDAGFEVGEGEIFVVMGLSGSGKSTLVRMLNRLIDPSAGTVRIDGQDVTQMKRKELVALRRRDISMVFQSFALMPHQTVLENTAFGLRLEGKGKKERSRLAREALEAVGLASNINSYPDELSGGMKQRVGLARALACNPGLLLMDEAFSALDPLIRTEMQDELIRLQAEHARTVVFITHDLDEAMRVGDRIAIMQDGRVVQVGTPEEIVRNPANDYVRSFFRGVDIGHVFTAGDAAHRAQVTLIERAGSSIRAALARLDNHGRTSAVVHDREQRYLGTVDVDSLGACLESLGADDQGSLEQAFIPDVPVMRSDAALSELMEPVAQSTYPVPVVDDDDRYVGAISRAALLQVLSRNEQTEEAATQENA